MPWPTTSRQSRGYGAEWERTRKRILKRDEHLCQRCARNGRVTLGNEVHHVKPKAQGGTDADENLETLCGPCHLEADAETQGKTLNPKTGFDVRGNPTDPDHPWNRAGRRGAGVKC